MTPPLPPRSHIERPGYMIHYTCDRCKQSINPEEELRYVVKLEVHAAMEPLELDNEDERDHLMEIQDILEHLEAHESAEVCDDVYQKRHYDLCADCYRQYMKNPVGREPATQLGFSQN